MPGDEQLAQAGGRNNQSMDLAERLTSELERRAGGVLAYTSRSAHWTASIPRLSRSRW